MLMHGSFPHPTPLLFVFKLPALLLLTLCCVTSLATAQGTLPMDTSRHSTFAQIDFARIYANQQAWERAERHNGQIQDEQQLVQSGGVSIYDLQAPAKAIRQLNRGTALLKAQRSKDAIPFLEKAIQIYPQFVSAHIALGLAYFDQRDNRAHDEFKTAATLDNQFPVAFFDLGVTEIGSHDYAAASSDLQKAVELNPNDTKMLTALSYARSFSSHYAERLQTALRVHQVGDQGMPSAHYIAAYAAMNLQDFTTSRQQLSAFLAEDPTNPLAPFARKHLEDLEHPNQKSDSERYAAHSPIAVVETFPNSDRLHNQLGVMSPDTDSHSPIAGTEPVLLPSSSFTSSAPVYHFARRNNDLFTIRRTVDETALFVFVSQKGHAVSDLSASDFRILDDSKPPERILQFTPQSQLPLRLGLLIDTSASVEHRFKFEKIAAKKFIERVVDPESDLAFVAGFDNSVSVTQDFSADPSALGSGIAKLTSGGDGTSVFDAVEFACRKLADYPDEGRVARVLVILTDGQDNSSHQTLMQSIDAAEDFGVTIYTVNTADDFIFETDAARILQTVAERSGGAFLFPKSLRDLDRELANLPALIRSRYLVAYRPANFQPNGKFRSLQVRASKDGKDLKVHVRKGYYARLADAQ